MIFILILSGCHTAPAKPPGYRYIMPVHVTVDKEFNQYQQKLIYRAFHTWEIASQNKVRFVINWNANKPTQSLKDHDLQSNSGNFIWHVTMNEYQLGHKRLEMWKENLAVTSYSSGPDQSGEFSTNVAILDVVKDDNFYPVLLHEIGHMIGLRHTNSIKSIMHWRDTTQCITELDAYQLCYLYGCTPQPDCPVAEADRGK